MITIDDFSKCDIRVVKVLDAERVEGSEKLIKLRVDIGEEERQILAGVGLSYTPEELVGKEIIAIVNLEPRMMMGLESQGMVLAASNGLDNIAVLTPDRQSEIGVKIK